MTCQRTFAQDLQQPNNLKWLFVMDVLRELRLSTHSLHSSSATHIFGSPLNDCVALHCFKHPSAVHNHHLLSSGHLGIWFKSSTSNTTRSSQNCSIRELWASADNKFEDSFKQFYSGFFLCFFFKVDGKVCPSFPPVTKRREGGRHTPGGAPAGGAAGPRAAGGCHLPDAGAGAGCRPGRGARLHTASPTASSGVPAAWDRAGLGFLNLKLK